MAQISRPFQIGLVVVVLLAGVWLFALQGHSGSPSASSTTSSPVVTSTVSPSTSAGKSAAHGTASAHSSVPLASREAAKAGAPTPVYHGSAPGVEGLTRAIAKAHEAVAISQQNANTLESRSRQASGEAPSSSAAGASSSASNAAATTSSTASAPAAHSTATAAGSTHSLSASTARHTSSSARTSSSALAVPSGQKEVEAELKQGKIAVLLFWNPAGSDDVVDHNELQLLLKLHRIASKARTEEVRHAEKFFGLELDRKIAVHEVLASQVTDYGSITRGVQIYSTPTILVINPHGKVITLTGITDAYSIEQAIEEARAA